MTVTGLAVQVHGTPAPQGSKTAIVRNGRARLIEGGSTSGRVKHRAWRDAVTLAAKLAAVSAGLDEPLTGPLLFVAEFRFDRPKSVPRAMTWKPTRPDLDKLLRSTLDSLTDARVIEDDARVVTVVASKIYVEPDEWTGADMRVVRVSDDCAPGVE